MTARLHHERVAAGGATPARWLMMTHGIYGSGGNWRSIARKIVERRREWGAILVDLRGHGRSELGPPPHTIAACAGDVRALIDELATAGTEVDAICGHSFGGKVMLAVRAARASVAHTFVLDSTPSQRPGGWDGADNDVREVWDAMRALPRDWPRREDFIAALTSRGFSTALAQWLAMSVHPADGGGFRLGLELDAIREMLTDYFATDLWSAVEDPSLPGDVHVLVAERADTVTPADRARLAAEPPDRRVHTHIVASAGHWLHIDAPAAVVDRVAAALI